MNSELRGSRIFHRYHQAHSHHGENHDHERDGKRSHLTPTRNGALSQSTKSFGSRTMTTTSHIVDDLTLGFCPSPGHRSTTERNPKAYEASPASSKSFRIVTLDGCYEEQVSPLLTDSSSSTSSNKIRSVPTIPAPPRCVTAKRDDTKSNKKVTEQSMASTSIDEGDSTEKEDTNALTPPRGGARRRRSSHNRSHFVFDGNLSFGAVTRSPIYIATSPVLSYSPPPRRSYPGPMGLNYLSMPTSMSTSPITPIMPMPVTPDMAPMSPSPNAFLDTGSNHRKQGGKQIRHNSHGRKTPPPTPEEQRRRNRAMPSSQYEDYVLNPLRQEQFENYEKQQLQRQQKW